MIKTYFEDDALRCLNMPSAPAFTGAKRGEFIGFNESEYECNFRHH